MHGGNLKLIYVMFGFLCVLFFWVLLLSVFTGKFSSFDSLIMFSGGALHYTLFYLLVLL